MGTLIPLRFQPGINRELTAFSAQGGWVDCDRVRFRLGYPETIGGWTKENPNDPLEGTCRTLITWAALDSSTYRGAGTSEKYYILNNGTPNDITPIRHTTSSGDVTFDATDGSSTIVVTDTNHGATVNSWVTFSGASSLGGNVTADVLNQEYKISGIGDASGADKADKYRIIAKDTSGTTVVANSSDTGNGGSSVVGAYQVNAGGGAVILGIGWGSGAWGQGTWGNTGVTNANFFGIRIWFADNFGEDLIINPSDGAIYYWDKTNGLSTRATLLSSLAGANDVPQVATQVLVSDQDRHVIAFGCDPQSDPGVQDPLTIRFSDQENAADWAPTAENTAGELRLSSGSRIIRAIQTKREIIIFTDASVHAMQFIGPPFTFGLGEISRGVQIIGPLAVVEANDALYWMSQGRFMIYDGTVREIPCTVKEYVFDNLNQEQRRKVVAGHNAQFSEVWWFYPKNASENNAYVVYNYTQNIWYYGSMARSAWEDRGIFPNPSAASPDGFIYNHEDGISDGEQNPAVGLNSFIEGAPQEIETGDRLLFIRRIIPDVTFRNSTSENPVVDMTLKVSKAPGLTFSDDETESVTRTATTPVEQYDEQVYVRVRGRSFRFRIEHSDSGTAWRLGTPRADIRRDGRK